MKVGANANAIIIFECFEKSMSYIQLWIYSIDIISPWIHPELFPWPQGFSD